MTSRRPSCSRSRCPPPDSRRPLTPCRSRDWTTRPGQYLLGFYLPGDAAGTGSVNKTDITTIKSLLGDAATNSNYNFDADVNRDGDHQRQDLKLAEKNLGASTQVSPVVSVNLDPASDPALDRTTPYSTVHFAGEVDPRRDGDVRQPATTTSTTTATADSTGAYSIMVPLVSGSNTFTVTTQDGFGQSISGPDLAGGLFADTASTTPSTTSSGS